MRVKFDASNYKNFTMFPACFLPAAIRYVLTVTNEGHCMADYIPFHVGIRFPDNAAHSHPSNSLPIHTPAIFTPEQRISIRY